MKPREYFRSACFQDLILKHAICGTYRNAARLLNRVLHRKEGEELNVSSLNYYIESQGRKAAEHLDGKARAVFDEHCLGEPEGLDSEGAQRKLASLFPAPCAPEGGGHWASSREKIDEYNSERQQCDQILRKDLVDAIEADQGNCVYISADDVGVTHQKDHRRDGGSKDGEKVQNSVIHVEHAGKKHIITALGMRNAFVLLMAFLISNDLLENKDIVIFSDGARNIRKCVEELFQFKNPVHMLDYYHLEKRMKEFISMAIKGDKESKRILRNVLDSKLWAGNVDEAISFLKNIPEKKIKNKARLDEAVDYLERRKANIGCYAMRSLLGLPNSSNPAEKSNDLVVATRQKHNGMSWSYKGSSSLALLTAISKNKEMDAWIARDEIPFGLNAEVNREAAA